MPVDHLSTAEADPRQRDLLHLVGTVVGRLAPEPVPMADAGQLLIEDLGYHSLALVELTFLLEELFSLGQAEAADVADIRSVADVARYISGVIDPEEGLPGEDYVMDLLEDFVAPAE
jgi:acyl carrier protein